MENSKLGKCVIFMMVVILVVGTISTIMPASYAQPSYIYEDPYAKDQKPANVNTPKIKCVNSNVNINGIDVIQIPQDQNIATETQALGDGAANGNGHWNDAGINLDKDLVNICVNVNVNNQVDVVDDVNGPTPEECAEFVACFDIDQEYTTTLLTELQKEGGITIENVPGVGTYVIGPDVTTLEELCEWLFTPQPNGVVITTEEQLEFVLNAVVGSLPGVELLACLVEAADLIPSQ